MAADWRARLAAMLLASWITGGYEARAQDHPVALEATVGWAGFVDDARIDHAVSGAGARVVLTPRVSVGPEFAWMVGPGGDRDVFVLGLIWIDLLAPAATKPIAPYCVFGAGYMGHGDDLGRGLSYWSHEGAFNAGGGARMRIGDRVYVGGDVRIGWELHLRATAHVGVTWPRH